MKKWIEIWHTNKKDYYMKMVQLKWLLVILKLTIFWGQGEHKWPLLYWNQGERKSPLL